jgi:hypothetical protein
MEFNLVQSYEFLFTSFNKKVLISAIFSYGGSYKMHLWTSFSNYQLVEVHISDYDIFRQQLVFQSWIV